MTRSSGVGGVGSPLNAWQDKRKQRNGTVWGMGFR